jgi:hypothetical protein
MRSRRMSWARHVAYVAVRRGVHRVLVRNLRKTLSIKMDLQVVGWEDMDYTDLAQDRDRWWALVNTVMHLQVP